MNRRYALYSGILICLLLVLAGVFFGWREVALPVDLEVVLAEDQSVVIDLTSAASRCKPRHVILQDLPQRGWLKGTLPELTYQPFSNANGEDRFSFWVRDPFLKRYHPATVKLSITAVNDPPVTNDLEVSLLEDQTVALTIRASDPEGDALTLVLKQPPKHGSLTGSYPNLVYTPAPDFFGEDRATYLLKDQRAESQPATITFSIAPRNDPPVARSVQVKTYRGFPVTIEIRADDPDDSELTPKSVTRPAHGTLKRSDDRFIYRPHDGYTGQDRFRYRVSDGKARSNTAVVTIQVYPFRGAEQLTRMLDKAIRRGGVAIGDGHRGGYLFRNGYYKPASILKLATALAAMHVLDEDTRFQTEFYVQNRNLYMKGYADPSLTTAAWHRIAGELSARGVFEDPLRRMVLDDTAVEKGIDFEGRGRSISYFDAPLGALASNYNTAEVNIQSDHRVLPWKDRTPVTRIARRRARGLPAGYQHFSIATEPAGGTLYSGELARAIFQDYGLVNQPPIELGTVPASGLPIYTHDSHRVLRDIVETMLVESSNFIANQLLLAMAINRFGEPVTLMQGVQILRQYLIRQVQLQNEDFTIVEGSGLSHQNRIELTAMLQLLNAFVPYRDLLPPLTKSKYSDLIRIGKRWPILAKTGTMSGVSTLAGFLKLRNQQWLPFVIMLEGEAADRARVLQIICRFFYAQTDPTDQTGKASGGLSASNVSSRLRISSLVTAATDGLVER